jgi:signal transduction histidine kinase
MTNQANISLGQLQTLYDVSRKVNSELDLDRVLDDIMDEAIELLQAEKGLIFLREEDTGDLTAKVARSQDKRSMDDILAMSRSAVDRVVSKAEPVLFQAAMDRDIEEAGPSVFRLKIQSIVSVPLKVRDKLVGVIYLDTTNKKHFFKEEDLHFLEAFSNLAAVAIENAKNYREVQNLNTNLEKLVEKRTEELSHKHQELGKAYQDLQEAQVNLIRSEKMASLGMLVAGVAHEINTPLGSIHSNTDTFLRSLNKANERLGELLGDLDTDSVSDLTKSLNVMTELTKVNRLASERIMQIVKVLRNFARLDEEEVKTVSLHEGLDSTLDLIQHLHKNRIKVIRQYGDIPELNCRAGHLNQVFMNLLVNACQAISDIGEIYIRTSMDRDQIMIQIEDTGVGIPAENMERLFDPGFTTKGVGVGTGLGLSIAYKIIEDHQGTIEVESDVGKGSKFTIRLPCKG